MEIHIENKTCEHCGECIALVDNVCTYESLCECEVCLLMGEKQDDEAYEGEV